ncbi:MAG: phosphatase PAP2 family protein [Alphaproteobacteria bacterium]|nr:phosphatase PAP2 family protein [Alphaproteobacteria bacterium]
MIARFALATVLALSLARPTVGAELSRSGYADGMRVLLPLGAAAGSAVAGDWEGLKQLAFSGAVTVALTEGLKHTVDSERPDRAGNDSFPSGHAATAFAGASYVYYRYGWQWGLPAELAAAGVAWAQVEDRRHHWVDVLAAAGLANLSSFVYVDGRTPDVIVMPIVGGKKDSFGVLIKLGF